LPISTRWRRRRWTGEQPDATAGSSVAGVDAIDAADTAEVVHRALLALPIEQRAVLVLRYFEQRSEAEIAALLGIAGGTVKSRAARGLDALRAQGCLDDDLRRSPDGT
ncbi:MAG: SigE family RNA polymerase sigma factor, partial [Acidimicrobiia bacterium]|nr:SigE family RNA polymerase sigma factor [Acidimicrobiia bacterium]